MSRQNPGLRMILRVLAPGRSDSRAPPVCRCHLDRESRCPAPPTIRARLLVKARRGPAPPGRSLPAIGKAAACNKHQARQAEPVNSHSGATRCLRIGSPAKEMPIHLGSGLPASHLRTHLGRPYPKVRPMIAGNGQGHNLGIAPFAETDIGRVTPAARTRITTSVGDQHRESVAPHLETLRSPYASIDEGARIIRTLARVYVK